MTSGRRCPRRARCGARRSVAAAARNSSTSRPSTGCVRFARHAGSASTGRRSISRTRKRKERERAATTIEARSATDSGAAASSACSTVSREARWRDERAVGGQQAAEVDDPPHAGGARRAREGLGLAALDVDEALPRRRPPSSGSGSRRRRPRPAPGPAPRPSWRRRARGRRVAPPPPAPARASGRSRARRGRRARGAARARRRRSRTRR